MNNKTKRSVHRPAVFTVKVSPATSGARIYTAQEFEALLKRVEQEEKKKASVS
ncbi:hypothetical protein [Effusibacillus pohliae]|uniref:hypothetical protein n=1 Tax=Effusibacillus pohliae TaxID=232270 RepID=UPI00036FB7DF|nr:hypothetical protein [Effusibacillus pohliae]